MGRRVERRRKPAARGAAGKAGAALLVAGVLAGCGGGVVPDADEPFGQFLRGTNQPAAGIDPETLRPPPDCPPVELLPQTETIQSTRGGNEFEPGVLVWQARIDRTARECNPGEGGTVARVGVAGRALSGPEGPAGTVRLPIRIAVREGDNVTYSQLHRVEVTLTEGEPARDFAFVDENVPVADVDAAEILVGFDERGR